MAAYLLEEAYEVMEIVEGGDPGQALGELGGLAFHIVVLAELYAETGDFDLGQVLEAVEAKMVRFPPISSAVRPWLTPRRTRSAGSGPGASWTACPGPPRL
ncbi:hypothetical protein DFAR_660018 [Desulfarculales bacterium]